MSLTKQRINGLQDLLLKGLRSLAIENNFVFKINDKETTGISINLSVNTQSPEEYTIRPSITVKKEIFQKIAATVNTSRFSVFNCGHFYIDQKLAHFTGCNKYDECKENRFNSKNPLFLFRISSEVDVEELLSRIHEMFNDFINAFLTSLLTELSLLKSYQEIIYQYDNDLSIRPNVSFLERPLMLDINAFLTYVYLSQKLEVKNSLNDIKMFLSHVGNKEYWITPTVKILETFDSSCDYLKHFGVNPD